MMKKLFQTQCPTPLVPVLACALTLHSGCKSDSELSPAGYTLNKPVEMQLGKSLNEISGLHYETDSVLWAIADNKEHIFEIHLKNKKLKDNTGDVVPRDSDLEDIVRVDSLIWVLQGPGALRAIPVGARDSSGVQVYPLYLEGTNDFETLYHEPKTNSLVIMCKTCAHEKGKQLRTAYRFDLEKRQFDTAAYFTVSKDEVEAIMKDADAKFDPSAAAIHPLTGQLYILSSAGNLLIITDPRGKVIEGYPLNPDTYAQAEGIAFAPNGNMYISNEGKYGKPTLLFFPYRTKGKKSK